MRTVFVENEILTEYHGLADFSSFDEERILDESDAKALKQKFPFAFRIYDEDGKEITDTQTAQTIPTTEGLVELTFIPGDGRSKPHEGRVVPVLETEYHSTVLDVDQSNPNQFVSQDIADSLIAKFPLNFAITNQLLGTGDKVRCSAMTIRGSQCQRPAQHGDVFCGQHKGKHNG